MSDHHTKAETKANSITGPNDVVAGDIVADVAAMIVCPMSGGPLVLSSGGSKLFSKQAQVSFPVVGGVPDLRVGSSQPILAPDE